MTSILEQILEDKKQEVALGKNATSIDQWQQQIAPMPKPLDFAYELTKQAEKRGGALITEIKRASPSKGILRDPFDVSALAASCQAGGGDALSIITDQKWFKGSEENIKKARLKSHLPILRKDFIIDEWQIYQSRALGADCILLIMAALSDQQACQFEKTANILGLGVLVESHNEEEIKRALKLETTLIGVNNRDLKTLTTSLEIGKALLKKIPKDRLAIAESGIGSQKDFQIMCDSGAQGFLISESIMREDNVEQAVINLCNRIKSAQFKTTNCASIEK